MFAFVIWAACSLTARSEMGWQTVLMEHGVWQFPGDVVRCMFGQARPRHHLVALQRVAWIHSAAQGQEVAKPQLCARSCEKKCWELHADGCQAVLR